MGLGSGLAGCRRGWHRLGAGAGFGNGAGRSRHDRGGHHRGLVRVAAARPGGHAVDLAGGPFPYDKDGTTFFNRERLLPLETRGFYREYTVPTPGLRHRGARRIVCGGPDAVRVKIVVA